MTAFLGLDIGAVGLKAALLLPRETLNGTPVPASWRRIEFAPPGGIPWCAFVPPARRTRGRPLVVAAEMLNEIASFAGNRLSGIMLTGAGARLVAETSRAPRCNEFQALARAISATHPHVRTVFEIGGETSRYLRLEPSGDGALQIQDYGTNGDCAAGTGGFLDQQAGRLHYAVEEIGSIVASAARTAQIAGRCSVFAKSDMIHAQQKGFQPPEVLKGLCKAVALNFKAAVVKGRTPEKPVAFVGGVAANTAVVQELRQAFDLAECDLCIPACAEAIGGLGAALLAAEARPGADIAVTDLTQRLTAAAGHSETFPALSPLSLDGCRVLRDQVRAYEFPTEGRRVDAFLGLDIGSVGTKLVLIDSAGEVIHHIFTRTDGRPIEVVTRCLREIEEAVGDRVNICGVGTTGSGRELIGELVGADSIHDEITCHKTGAAFVGDRYLGKRPDTIFEIGGQDSKYISLQPEDSGETVVVDFTMNEACAAGTGSFLEERAEELGVAIRGEFSQLAMRSQSPLRLGERCTVFMERDVNTCMQRGARREDVIAGLAYSVVYNYINRVVRGRHIGECIFFQGGTACNDAVVAAFRAVTGREIIVPPHNAVLGAIGAALLAGEKMLACEGAEATRFRGYDMTAVDYTLREFTCKGCGNLCSIQEFNVEGEKTFWGDKCSDRYRKQARTPRKPVIPDLVAVRQQYIDEDDTGEPAHPVGTIGIPLAMYTMDLLPLWRRFFRACGWSVVVSTGTNRKTIRQGTDTVVAEPCFPILVAHGHVAELVERNVDYIWIPNILSTETRFLDNESHVCPWGQTLPFVIRAAPAFRPYADRILCPTFRLRESIGQVRPVLVEVAKQLGIPSRRAHAAVDAGLAALRRFRTAYQEAGRAALQKLEQTGESGIVLVGRPYNVHDGGVSLQTAAKLRDLYGVNVLPIDCLPVDDIDIRDVNSNMYWAYGRRILATARLVARYPNLHIIYITNFKCGPDSYVKAFIRPASGKPFLSLQFDGHSNDAGMMTRCEAYLDSKGILRWWRKQESSPSASGAGGSISPRWPGPEPALLPRRFDPSGSKPPSRPHPTPKR